jgi:hypothetical protein
MSHLFDRLNFLQKKSLGTFANGHGEVTAKAATGRTPTGTAGGTTRSCARPTG